MHVSYKVVTPTPVIITSAFVLRLSLIRVDVVLEVGLEPVLIPLFYRLEDSLWVPPFEQMIFLLGLF